MPPLRNRSRELQPLCQPKTFTVLAGERNMPRAVVRNGRTLQVVRIRDRWRVDDTWWRKPVSRMYFELELEDGDVQTVFFDMIGGGWYQQRYGEVG